MSEQADDDDDKIRRITDVRPKTVTTNYRDSVITVRFDPFSKTFRWFFEYKTSYSGEAQSIERALQEAKKIIDKMIDG